MVRDRQTSGDARRFQSVWELDKVPRDLPRPAKVTYRELSTGDEDAQFVSVNGIVRSMWIQPGAEPSHSVWIKLIANSPLRIGQEAIANAIRQADPKYLEILLNYEKHAVVLTVTDDGDGFVKSEGLLGFGLRGMRTENVDPSPRVLILPASRKMKISIVQSVRVRRAIS